MRKYPTTYIFTENAKHVYTNTEKFYNKYCKFTLGISKYSSNTLTLGELGRYPILIKQATLGILYWWRIRQGTENFLLNKAYNIMKKGNHPWLQNIQCFLFNIGLGNIWINSGLMEKDYVRQVVTERLQDIFKQHYDEYFASPKNTKKYRVLNCCYIKD